MAKRGKSIRQIAQEVGHNRRTVARDNDLTESCTPNPMAQREMAYDWLS